ncbi:MAG TPA: XdhC family protein [Streptosporangiaceae bacterium]|nr:XdhC family protein [Streptosporangiaceae bacterium]
MDDVHDLLSRTEELRSDRTPYVLATVVRAERPTSAKAGDRALVLPDGTLEGFVGGSCAESTVRLQGLRLLETGDSALLRITPTDSPEPQTATGTAAEGVITVGNPCLSGGTLDIFLEAVLPPVLVHVYGDAPIARALAKVGAALGYDIRAATDPAAPIAPDTTAVVVASHGRDEEAVLSAALRAGVPYVGLIASRRRGAAVVAELDRPDADRVRTPAGLDIGARTAPEVALSVLAEIMSVRPAPERPGGRAPRAPTPAEREATDPVCGMRVAITDATPRAEHGGATRYFCGTGCRDAFAADPAAYL